MPDTPKTLRAIALTTLADVGQAIKDADSLNLADAMAASVTVQSASVAATVDVADQLRALIEQQKLANVLAALTSAGTGWALLDPATEQAAADWAFARVRNIITPEVDQ